MAPEKITFQRSVTESDGASGSVEVDKEVYECTGEVTVLKPSRLLEANQESIRQGYRIRIWVTKKFEPQVGDTILCRGEALTIQGYRYTDELNTRYDITALEQVNGS